MQLSRGLVDDADRHIEEAHLPMSLVSFLDSDRLAGERTADVDVVAAPFDLAVGAHLAHNSVARILRLRKAGGQRTRRPYTLAGVRWPSATRESASRETGSFTGPPAQ